jgi:predicted DCC family thiol-disulfide oxidoreductase YuxK
MNQTYPLTLYYDGSCQMCRAEMHNLGLRDIRSQLRFVDIAVADAASYPAGTDRTALMGLIHAQCADGRVLKGVEVFRLAYSAAGLPWVARFTRLPVIGALCESLYPLIARNRYRLPAAPIRWLFEVALRRAARASAQRLHCGDDCRIDPHQDHGKDQP